MVQNAHGRNLIGVRKPRGRISKFPHPLQISTSNRKYACERSELLQGHRKQLLWNSHFHTFLQALLILWSHELRITNMMNKFENLDKKKKRQYFGSVNRYIIMSCQDCRVLSSWPPCRCKDCNICNRIVSYRFWGTFHPCLMLATSYKNGTSLVFESSGRKC